MKLKILGIFLSLAFVGNVTLADSEEAKCISTAKNIDQKLACLKGMTFKEINGDINTPLGARQFEIQFKQLVDHTNPSLGTFSQKLALIHRSEAEPMVLQTSGYSIFGVRQAAITATFETNQLQVEHRYFSTSVPEKLDWTKLDIKQSADDFHRIVESFKQIYGTRWVNTGASKGGMTSIYHKYFYPNDLDGTVADVAPLSFSLDDPRYVTWVETVGGDTYKKCREDLQKLQIELLKNRGSFSTDAVFNHLGKADIAFEHAVIEMSFAFWQYASPTDPKVGCAKIPVAGSVQEMLNYLALVNSPEGYADVDLLGFLPYFYQAATQLGGPGSSVQHLKNLLKYDYSIDMYTPKGVVTTYSNQEMLNIEKWAKNNAEKVMYVYGEFDPWTSGEFPLNTSAKEVYKFFAPKMNHGANFRTLNSTDKAKALKIIGGWLNKQAVLKANQIQGTYLEDIELLARKKNRL